MPLQKGDKAERTNAFHYFLCLIYLCRMKEVYSCQDARDEVTEQFLRNQIVPTQIF